MKASLLAALNHDGVGLADRLLSAFNEMTTEQWDAAAKVIGEALDERIVAFAPYQADELWLRDMQRTAWRVRYTAPGPMTWQDHEAFHRGWEDV
ncbi:hypothetical protein ACFUJU_19700 [Streptomyces sp. NPDC057235]|uniref:hypothetical protein n=1 Tax=Streptomyces sp. NPDC057235 TaxID=3346058 RepID=UPI0036354BBF